MTNEQFDALVAKLEAQARNHPGWYRLRVFLLALLANAYIGVMIILIALVFFGSLASVVVTKGAALKFALIVGFVLWTVLKSLWVTIDAPEGFEVRRKQAPELFALIDELRRALRAPRFHHVLVTDDFNAAVMQLPRLGLFGWDRNYLLIGLPLLKTLRTDQFKAVLAHEFGHLAKGHGRLSNWIYRQRLRWSRLVSRLEDNQQRGVFLFKPFLNWFSPYFSAFSFPLARANEFEADATSARVASPRAAAEALTAVNVLGSYLTEQFWPQVHRLADDQPRPNFTPYAALGQRLGSDLQPDSLERWLQQAMAAATTSMDTHPALKDRLGAIGETPRLAPPAAGESADRLLGGTLAAITAHFDSCWQDRIFHDWQRRYDTVQNGRKSLAVLDEKAASGGELSLQQQYDRAVLTEQFGSAPTAALDQFRQLYERAPEDPYVNFALGCRLLALDDADGVRLIERAMELDDAASVQCYQQLRDYHWRHGREEQAHALHQRLVERANAEQQAEAERSRVTVADTFVGHGLDAAALGALRDQLHRIEGLAAAWLVRKQVRYFPEKPCYILGFTKQRGWFGRQKYTDDEVMWRLQNKVEYPVSLRIVNVGNLPRVGRRMKKAVDARVI